MNLTDIKLIKAFCNGLFSTPDWREVVKYIESGDIEFEIDNVRFIHTDTIQEVLEDELASDEYVLGCFNASAIADATGWPIELIEIVQEGEQYEALGKAMTGEHVAELARIYVQLDGYGHHFN